MISKSSLFLSSDEKCIQHSYYRAPCLVPRAKWLRMSTRPLGRRHPHQWYCAVRRPHRLHNLRTHVQKRLYSFFIPSRFSPELSRFGFLLQAACTCHLMLRHDPFLGAATVRTHQHAHNRRDDIRPILLIWSSPHFPDPRQKQASHHCRQHQLIYKTATALLSEAALLGPDQGYLPATVRRRSCSKTCS